MTALVLYGLAADAAPGPLPPGAQGEPVQARPLGTLFALIGAAPAPALDERALRAHDAAVRALHALHDAFLPARFGSVCPDASGLADALGSMLPRFAAALELVRGREQMTVRAFGAPATAAELGQAGPGTRHLRARAQALRIPEADPLRAATASLVRAERSERHEGAGDALFASLYHLVDRGGGQDYAAAIEAARSSLGGIRVAWSGPWPPWAFVPEAGP